MTDQTNAELIAENRKWFRLHQSNNYQEEAARRMALILDALEAADQRAAELAAVIEQAEDHLTRHFLDMLVADEVLPILASAPADLLRDVKADVWDEGADAMAEHIDNGAWWEIQNPYRAREEQS